MNYVGKAMLAIRKKFLGTFTAYTSTAAKALPKGPNDLAPVVVEHELAQQLANTDTLALTLPQIGVNDFIPSLIAVMTPSSSNVRTSHLSYLSVTSYNKSTGVVTLTATNTIPVTSNIQLLLTPASDSAAS